VDPLVEGDLRDRVTQLVNDKRALQSDVETLRAQAADGTSFAQAATLPLVADQLTGRGVVVISLPGTPGNVRDNLLDLLGKAGAHVTARISLTDAYGDPAKATVLESTVAASTPSDVVLSGTTASQRSGELLAAVLSRPTPLPAAPVSPSAAPVASSASPGSGSPTPTAGATRSRTTAASASASASATATLPAATTTPPDGQTATVLAAYASAGLLTVDADTPVASDLVLILTADGPAEGQAPAIAAYDGYVDLIGALVGARHASVVVAGPTNSIARGVVDYVRRSGVDPRVSTVDAAETPAGAVATIRALRAQLFGTSGRYGAAAGDAALPPVDGQ